MKKRNELFDRLSDEDKETLKTGLLDLRATREALGFFPLRKEKSDVVAKQTETILEGATEKQITSEFPAGKTYEKKTEELIFIMKKLTEIERKTDKKEKLTKEDLLFLYEVDSKIEGFNHNIDSRIKEIRDKRNSKEDAPVVFGCWAGQIAWSKNEITRTTEAYIGPLYPGIFKELSHLEHIYTSFPEGRIVKSTIEIGGKTKEDLEKEMKEKNIKDSSYAESMVKNKNFTTAKNTESMDLIRLKVRDLGINKGRITIDDIYTKAKELGLELCPAETGPQYRLQYLDQPSRECLYIGMKQITDSHGRPRVFRLRRVDAELWLSSNWAELAYGWDPDDEFVFRLRK